MMFCKALVSRLTNRCFFSLLCFSIFAPALAGSTSLPAGRLESDGSDFADFLKAQAARGAKTMALEVYDHRQLRKQFYGTGFTSATRAQGFSVTKSLTAVAIGAAAQQLGLNLTNSICAWLTEARERGLCGITLVDVLQMSSGLRWQEEYSPTSADSQVLQMLYGSGATAMASFVLAQPSASIPGKVFNYSSGDTMILAAVLDSVTNGRAREFVQREVLDKIGLSTAIWEADRSGTLVGAASLYINAPELAQVGFMMLDGGLANGSAVISPEFFRESLSPARPGVAYGYQWWLNEDGVPDTQADKRRRWPSATPRTFAALGHWGQYLVVVPEEDLVIVRLGDDKTASFDLDGLIRIVRGVTTEQKSAQSMKPLNPMNPKFKRVESVEIPPAMLEHALGFGAKTACSCANVSLFKWDECESYLQLPNLPRLEYRRSVAVFDGLRSLQRPMIEARLNGFAKAAVFNEGEGCVLINDHSYKIEMTSSFP
jgi:CubicO group peptidase (beta-lactamase class C family)